LSICGVKNGDVWLAINGVQLDSPEQALTNYRRIMDAPLWTLDLIRGGQELRVVVAIR
jgi:type II secretory pathway component PulC